jgi:Alpha-glucuronidase
MKNKLIILGFTFFFVLAHPLVKSQVVDLSKSEILASNSIKSPLRETIIQTLQEEIGKRAGLLLPNVNAIDKQTIIALATRADTELAKLKVPNQTGEDLPEEKPEGFRIKVTQENGKKILWLLGADSRGVLFAAGQFLRTALFSKNKLLFDTKNEITTSPAYPIRGHQVGYRNTANSWDSWTPAQFEQYFRDLALFGTNAIENIPFQDGPLGPHMKYNCGEMNTKLSEICNKYDLDYWVWTPADGDLSKQEVFDAEVKKHADFYKNTPRLDGVFFPGGDPGDNHPKYVLPFLKAIAAELKKYHPNAGVWISLQGFSYEQVDYFYDYLNKNNPDWLAGVVSGPSSPDIAETRFRLPTKYKHRHYPDLTHTVRCQYPVENWDQAFALTEGREICNPQPFYYAKIHNRFAPFTDGFISYSDGSHDDVNKVVWSQMAWNPEKDVTEVVTEYCCYFFGNSVATDGANGILALERNWVGSVEENGGIEATLSFWQNLEQKHPELKGNWRWQQLVMRSYYDAYVRRRKIYEQNLEKEANQILAKALQTGAEKAMADALELVNKADRELVSPEMRQKVFDYCEALWKSIGAQTSVKMYNASGPERGAILDYIDYPLNNRWWLADEFDKIRKMNTEQEKLARLEVISKWENPGPGSYYDNVSDLSKGPHVKTRTEDGTDVAWWDSGKSRKRLSTQLFQNFPRLEYADLDPNGRYIIRIAGYGEALVRADGERLEPTVYNKGLEEFKEFLVNQKYVSDGKLVITFDQPEESKLNWRQQSKVCDVWLLKL